jgi:hypothetical protein
MRARKSVTDFLEGKHHEITARLNELKPLVEEYHRLDAANSVLNSLPGAPASPNGRRRPGRPPSSKNTKMSAKPAAKQPATRKPIAAKPVSAKRAGKRRGGRRKGTGRRAIQTLQVITDNPGITISEIATKMNIQQNYLYRVIPNLQREGKVKKHGRGWHPTA